VSRLIAVSILLWPALAWAHGFQVEARWADGQVLVEAYFGDGGAPGAGEVVVRRGEEEVARGALSEGGLFRWTPPAPGRYRFEVTEPGLHTAFAELEVPADPVAPITSAVSAPSPATPRPSDRARGGVLWRALLGVGVIAALAWGLRLVQGGRRE